MSDKKTILLIIDDEVDLLEITAYQLKAKGYEVITAQDGAEGLECLKTTDPALILLDMNMPKINGLEFYDKICDENKNPKYPVLFLSARANIDDLLKDLKVAGVMSKPFENDKLLQKIESIISPVAQ